MALTPQMDELLTETRFDGHVTTLAAAYTIYELLLPQSKRPVSQQEFHQKFQDHWQIFRQLEQKEF